MAEVNSVFKSYCVYFLKLKVDFIGEYDTTLITLAEDIRGKNNSPKT